jgi:AraC-like DNA-binding protein
LKAATYLRRNPTFSINQVASDLDITTRHLSRRFRAALHISPKLFTRIGRVGRVITARWRGATWADVAMACGYADQAHMVADFSALVGCGPDQYFRAISSPSCRDINAALLRGGFRNLGVPLNTILIRDTAPSFAGCWGAGSPSHRCSRRKSGHLTTAH